MKYMSNMSKPHARKGDHENRTRPSHDKFPVEDERGWSGQHGQRPANDEEKNYRPTPQRENSPGKK